MLKLGRQGLVFRRHRPAVLPHVPVDLPQGQHGFNGEHHARNHKLVKERGCVVVGDDEARMERRAHTVSGEVPDHSVPKASRVGFDSFPNDVDLSTRRHRLDAPAQCLLGSLHQRSGLLGGLPGEERHIEIAVHAAFVGGDVDIDEVPFLEDRVIWDSVTDDLVERGAAGFWVPPVPER